MLKTQLLLKVGRYQEADRLGRVSLEGKRGQEEYGDYLINSQCYAFYNGQNVDEEVDSYLKGKNFLREVLFNQTVGRSYQGTHMEGGNMEVRQSGLEQQKSLCYLDRFEALVRGEHSDEQNRLDLVLVQLQRDYLVGVQETSLDEKLQVYQETL